MYKLSFIDKFSFMLIILGSINSGLIGLINFNLLNFLFKFSPIVERLLYILIGLAAINILLFIKKAKYYKHKNK